LNPGLRGLRRTRSKDVTCDEHVRNLSAHLREVRLVVEDVRDAGEGMELGRDLRVAQLLEESLAAFNRDGGVRDAVKQDRRRVRRGDVARRGR
jgi:hypothetical protein